MVVQILTDLNDQSIMTIVVSLISFLNIKEIQRISSFIPNSPFPIPH